MSTEQPVHLTPLPFGAAHVSLLHEVMILARCLAIARVFLINSNHPSDHILDSQLASVEFGRMYNAAVSVAA